MTVRWEILETTEYAAWFEALTRKQQDAVLRRVQSLSEVGPALGRPYVDSLRGSRFKGLKELRIASGGHLRVLFIFYPSRRCVLLLGGDKSRDNMWNDWYTSAITRAETIYERHLRGEDS
jgi:hypothetical protein